MAYQVHFIEKSYVSNQLWKYERCEEKKRRKTKIPLLCQISRWRERERVASGSTQCWNRFFRKKDFLWKEKKRAGQSKVRQTLCLGAGTPRLGSFFFVLGCLDGSRLDSYIFGFRYFEYIDFLFLSLIVKADQFSFLFHSISLHGRPACPNHKFTRCRPAPGTNRQYSLLSCTGLVWKWVWEGRSTTRHGTARHRPSGERAGSRTNYCTGWLAPCPTVSSATQTCADAANLPAGRRWPVGALGKAVEGSGVLTGSGREKGRRRIWIRSFK